MFNKKIAIIASLVIVFFSLIAAFFYLRSPKSVLPKLNRIETKKEVKIDTEYLKAQAVKNISDCLSTVNYYVCLPKFIEKVADCDLISSTTVRNNCLDNFKAIEVVKNAEVANCKDLSKRNQPGCYDTIFTGYENIEKCDNLNATDGKDRCYDLINYRQSIAKLNPTQCGLIKNAILRKNCLDTISNLPPDQDADGLDDSLELSLGLDPFNKDTDKDGLSDFDEIKKYKTNPLKRDTDGDGLSDKNEIYIGANPLKKDTDGDGFGDGDEVSKGYNPCGGGKMGSPEKSKLECQKYFK
ncbi:MAG: hypothetical protein WCG01_05505 [bacterium]